MHILIIQERERKGRRWPILKPIIKTESKTYIDSISSDYKENQVQEAKLTTTIQELEISYSLSWGSSTKFNKNFCPKKKKLEENLQDNSPSSLWYDFSFYLTALLFFLRFFALNQENAHFSTLIPRLGEEYVAWARAWRILAVRNSSSLGRGIPRLGEGFRHSGSEEIILAWARDTSLGRGLQAAKAPILPLNLHIRHNLLSFPLHTLDSTPIDQELTSYLLKGLFCNEYTLLNKISA